MMNGITMTDFDASGNELLSVHDVYGVTRKTAYMVTQHTKRGTSVATVYHYPENAPIAIVARIDSGIPALVERQSREAILAHCQSEGDRL